VYQGNELWDLHLVDPDNRQAVDFEARRQALASLRPAFELADHQAPSTAGPLATFVTDLLDTWPDGRIKLWLTARLLRLRQKDPHLFLHGSYMPLHVEGARWARVVAFARFHDNRGLITVVPRLAASLVTVDHGWPITDAVWQDTVVRIPNSITARGLRNVVTGESPPIHRSESGLTIAVGDILRACPIAVFVNA
jgi:(1->4)-alpha-D-glucan 1-alpha-D-glucosylmutase